MVEGDALEHRADVLVLKYAQSLHGVDMAAARALQIDEALLPAPDGHRTVDTGGRLGVPSVIFVGVERLRELDYGGIRNFAERGMGAVARDVPDAEEVAFTLHGVNFGLDEVEACKAELAGLLDAIRRSDLPDSLRRISFVERDARRVERIRAVLRTVLGDVTSVGVGGATSSWLPAGSESDLDRVGAASAERGHAFIAMPFAADFGDLFEYGISAAVRGNDLLVERIDETSFTGDVLERMKRRIREARVVVAVLTGANPNVYLEVGYAWAAGVPTVLLFQSDDDLKFDIRGQRALKYGGSIKKAEDLLTEELAGILADPAG